MIFEKLSPPAQYVFPMILAVSLTVLNHATVDFLELLLVFSDLFNAQKKKSKNKTLYDRFYLNIFNFEYLLFFQGDRFLTSCQGISKVKFLKKSSF